MFYLYRNRTASYILVISLLFTISSCSFKSSILFQTENSINESVFEDASTNAHKNYIIEANDRIALSIYTNKGEKLIDPNREFQLGEYNYEKATNSSGAGGQQMGMENINSAQNLPIKRNSESPKTYTVDKEGYINLPMVGKVQVSGLTLNETNELLVEKYKEFYNDPYIVTQYTNKKVFVIGGLGDEIIPLRNESMNVIEILALINESKGIQTGKVTNIRLIRPDPIQGLQNPSVQIIDLSTVDGLRKANLTVISNDIIYIEPRRTLDSEGLRDIFALTSIITSTVTALVSLVLLARGN